MNICSTLQPLRTPKGVSTSLLSRYSGAAAEQHQGMGHPAKLPRVGHPVPKPLPSLSSVGATALPTNPHCPATTRPFGVGSIRVTLQTREKCGFRLSPTYETEAEQTRRWLPVSSSASPRPRTKFQLRSGNFTGGVDVIFFWINASFKNTL